MSDSDVRVETVANDREVAEIERLQSERRFGLAFGSGLEPAYQRDCQQRAAAAFRYGAVLVLLLYVLLGAGIYILLPERDTQSWLTLYSGIGGVLLVAGVLSHVRRLEAWFNVYMGVCGFCAVMLSMAVTGVMYEVKAGQLLQATIIYMLMIVYGVVGLRFLYAALAGWTGGFSGLVLSSWLGGSFSWEILAHTYVGASVLGMFMAYYAERRDREMFLQSRLLQIAKWRTERYVEELDKLSREDGLTGLANRRHFDESLQQEWRRASRQKSSLAVLMIDVDNFKHFNDKLGHPEGDRCLRRVAKLLATYARRPGELVARYGGEEFVMIFPDTDHQQAVHIAEHVLDSIREARMPQPEGLERWYVTVSIGVSATVPSERLTPSRVLVAADQALYTAKNNGRNGWWYQSPDIQPVTGVAQRDASWMM
jgi:diguanylate cyclase (GGDEF)-like protein